MSKQQLVLDAHYARLRSRYPQKLSPDKHREFMAWVCGFRAHLSGETKHGAQRADGVTAAVTTRPPRTTRVNTKGRYNAP